MAVKKSKPEAVAMTPKAEPKQVAPAKLAPAARGKTPAVAVTTASKAETPKPVPAVLIPAAKAPAVKKAAYRPKLSGRQLEFLKQIEGTKADGYLLVKKGERRTIDVLLDFKLVKKGAKDKTSGHFRYLVSKAGAKHLSSTQPPARMT